MLSVFLGGAEINHCFICMVSTQAVVKFIDSNATYACEKDSVIMNIIFPFSGLDSTK